MRENTQEIDNIVAALNDEIAAQTNEPGGYWFEPVSLLTNGSSQAVTFFEQTVWCSENEERQYDEAKDAYEPLEPFIRRRVTDVLGKIAKINVLQEALK